MRTSIALCVCLLYASAWGQEERAVDNFSGVGVRAMGMGGAFAGVADDFTAVYWNPAGLAQIRQREVYVGFQRNSRDSQSVFNGSQGNSKLSNTRFGSLGFVYPYPVHTGSLVFAVGFNRVKDFDWNLNQRGFDESDSLLTNHLFQHEGELALSSLAAAVDVSPSISLGLTLGLSGGEDESSNEFSWSDRDNFFQERRFLATDTFSDDYGRTWYATLGAMVRSPRARPRLRMGATISTGLGQGVRYAYRGSPDGYNRIDYDDGTVAVATNEEIRGRYEIALPFEFGVGGSYVPIPGLLLAAGAHFAEWSQSEYEGGDDQSLRADTSFERQYRDVVRYHMGVEWQVPAVALDLRAGFYTDPLPFVGPRDPDPFSGDPPIRLVEDRRFITLGVGLLVDEVIQLDLAWVRGHFEQVEESFDAAQTLNTLREENTITRVLLGIAYRF
ncbi:MAG: long-subunit fatty acid transport protein [Candidatus Latescibacterota bacterium]|jgi:long-subunit fatty acid transport protein